MTSKECALPTQSLAQPKKRKKVFVSAFFHLWLWWQTTSEDCAGLRAASCQVAYSNSLPRSHSNTVQIQIQLKYKSKYAAYNANTHTAISTNTNLNFQLEYCYLLVFWELTIKTRQVLMISQKKQSSSNREWHGRTSAIHVIFWTFFAIVSRIIPIHNFLHCSPVSDLIVSSL